MARGLGTASANTAVVPRFWGAKPIAWRCTGWIGEYLSEFFFTFCTRRLHGGKHSVAVCLSLMPSEMQHLRKRSFAAGREFLRSQGGIGSG